MYHLKIGYIKELTKLEASRAFAVPPKEKAMVERINKVWKEKKEYVWTRWKRSN